MAVDRNLKSPRAVASLHQRLHLFKISPSRLRLNEYHGSRILLAASITSRNKPELSADVTEACAGVSNGSSIKSDQRCLRLCAAHPFCHPQVLSMA